LTNGTTVAAIIPEHSDVLEPRLVLSLKDWDGDMTPFPRPPTGVGRVRIQTRTGEEMFRNLALIYCLPVVQDGLPHTLGDVNELVTQSLGET
jgi:hypothetical protein